MSNNKIVKAAKELGKISGDCLIKTQEQEKIYCFNICSVICQVFFKIPKYRKNESSIINWLIIKV